MIELPSWAAPAAAEPFAIGFGFWLTPSTGAAEQAFERKGGRWGATLTLPPMTGEDAGIVISRLSEAWHSNEIVRVPWPLAGVSQGSPGEPVIDGADQNGKVIAMRSFNAGYAAREGYWLTIYDENGRGYLHNNRAALRVDGSGEATLTLSPMVRWPFADGASVQMAKPTIEGKVVADPWQIPGDRLFRVAFRIAEVA